MADNNIPTPTPLPSQWDSAIIRQLAYAGVALIAVLMANLFGLSTEAFEQKAGKIIDALLAFAVIATPLILAWRARLTKPTPPITEQAVVATQVREANIASAVNKSEKLEASK